MLNNQSPKGETPPQTLAKQTAVSCFGIATASSIFNTMQGQKINKLSGPRQSLLYSIIYGYKINGPTSIARSANQSMARGREEQDRRADRTNHWLLPSAAFADTAISHGGKTWDIWRQLKYFHQPEVLPPFAPTSLYSVTTKSVTDGLKLRQNLPAVYRSGGFFAFLDSMANLYCLTGVSTYCSDKLRKMGLREGVSDTLGGAGAGVAASAITLPIDAAKLYQQQNVIRVGNRLTPLTTIGFFRSILSHVQNDGVLNSLKNGLLFALKNELPYSLARTVTFFSIISASASYFKEADSEDSNKPSSDSTSSRDCRL